MGKGNATWSLASAESLRTMLHYKSKGFMAFKTLLTQYQRMFNISKQENEPMSEEVKIQFYFRLSKSKT